MEKERALKILEGAVKIAIPVGIMMFGSVWSFGSGTKQEIKQKTGGRCAQCGSSQHIECHHIVPHCLGGRDSVDNGIPLCGDRSRDCHEEWDEKALKQGVIYPGVPIEQAPTTLFKNPQARRSALKRFHRL